MSGPAISRVQSRSCFDESAYQTRRYRQRPEMATTGGLSAGYCRFPFRSAIPECSRAWNNSAAAGRRMAIGPAVLPTLYIGASADQALEQARKE